MAAKCLNLQTDSVAPRIERVLSLRRPNVAPRFQGLRSGDQSRIDVLWEAQDVIYGLFVEFHECPVVLFILLLHGKAMSTNNLPKSVERNGPEWAQIRAQLRIP